MSAPPIWRRAPMAGGGRVYAGLTIFALLALLALTIGGPLQARIEEAAERAARLDRRAAALTASAEALRREAEIAAPPADIIAAAVAYLDAHAPARDPDAAMLDLLSAVRLLADAADVRLISAAPLDLTRGARNLFPAAGAPGLTPVAAEARIAADHAGLARFLDAVARARPTLRAAALEVSARTARADAEADRLTARITIGALARGAE